MEKKLPNMEILRRVIDKKQTEHSLINEVKVLREENENLRKQLMELNHQLFEERKYYIEQIGNGLT